MSDIDSTDLYEGAANDTPLIDNLGSAVKRLIDKGRVRGFIGRAPVKARRMPICACSGAIKKGRAYI